MTDLALAQAAVYRPQKAMNNINVQNLKPAQGILAKLSNIATLGKTAKMSQETLSAGMDKTVSPTAMPTPTVPGVKSTFKAPTHDM